MMVVERGTLAAGAAVLVSGTQRCFSPVHDLVRGQGVGSLRPELSGFRCGRVV